MIKQGQIFACRVASVGRDQQHQHRAAAVCAETAADLSGLLYEAFRRWPDLFLPPKIYVSVSIRCADRDATGCI
jgi:hypothetical protein